MAKLAQVLDGGALKLRHEQPQFHDATTQAWPDEWADQAMLIRYNIGGDPDAEDITIDDGRPTLDFDFRLATIVEAIHGVALTHTRSTVGRTRNSSGLLASIAVDTPRYWYNNAGSCLGVLVEDARTNLLLQSEAFSVTWTQTGVTITDDAVAGPTGATDATTIVEDTSTGSHRPQQNLTPTAGNRYAYSLYAAELGAGSKRYLKLVVGAGAFANATAAVAVFDLALGTVVATNANVTLAYIEPETYTVSGTVYHRCVLVFVAGLTANTGFRIFFHTTTALNEATYTGDGVSGGKAFGAQLEVSDYATSYIPTTTVAATRALDALGCATSIFPANVLGLTDAIVLVAETYPPGSGTLSRALVSLDDDTTANRLQIYQGTAGLILGLTVTAGSAVFNSGVAFTARARNVVGALFRANDFAAFSASAAVYDSAGAIPSAATLTKFHVGAGHLYTSQLNGVVSRIRFYNTRKSNAALMALAA